MDSVANAQQMSFETQVDATTLKVTNGAGLAFVESTWIPNGPCSYYYYTEHGISDVVVSQAGVIVVRRAGFYTGYFEIFFPKKTHTLADLAGTFNLLGTELTSFDELIGHRYTGYTGSATINSLGEISAFSKCTNQLNWDVSVCQNPVIGPKDIVFNIGGDGNFVMREGFTADGRFTGGGRIQPYRSGNGDVMLFEYRMGGSFAFYTRQAVTNLPTIGARRTNLTLAINNNLTMPDRVNASSNTITAINSLAGSWTRNQKTVGGTDDHPETLLANNPRIGYTFRAAGTALAIDGTTATIREFTSLGLQGMGMSALLSPDRKQISLSVTQP